MVAQRVPEFFALLHLFTCIWNIFQSFKHLAKIFQCRITKLIVINLFWNPCVTHYGIYSLLSNIYEFWQRSKPHNKYNGCNYIVKLLEKPILNNKWVQESAQWSVIKITANPITIYCMLVKEEASLYRLARVIKNGWLLLAGKKWATDFYHPRKKFHNESLVIWFLEVCKSSVKRVIC